MLRAPSEREIGEDRTVRSSDDRGASTVRLMKKGDLVRPPGGREAEATSRGKKTGGQAVASVQALRGPARKKTLRVRDGTINEGKKKGNPKRSNRKRLLKREAFS